MSYSAFGKILNEDKNCRNWGYQDFENVLKEFSGRKITNWELHSNEDMIFIELDQKDIFVFYHAHNCCESVRLLKFDILPNTTIALAKLDYEDINSKIDGTSFDDTSFTHLKFYTYDVKYKDHKPIVIYDTLKVSEFTWIGTSNGYYSNSIDIIKLEEVIK